MPAPKTSVQLAKFLDYILGRRPDEFGLAPDADGFVRIKELLKVFNEEEGWRHVRRSLIEELRIILSDSPIELRDNDIRAVRREHLPRSVTVLNPPKLLFVCASEKSYPAVLEKGVLPTFHQSVILSVDRDMALRIGNRHGQRPVLLTVHAGEAMGKGVVFKSSGELLLLADFIPVGVFDGPPLPKIEPEPKKPAARKPEPVSQPMPGSFLMRIPGEKGKSGKNGGDKASWKRDKKRLRREKDRFRQD